MVICLVRGADLDKAQLMTLPLTVSCFSKIQIGFTFLVPAHPGSPGKRAVKRVCVLLLLYASYYMLWRCWLGDRKGIRPVKNWTVGCWHGYLSGARCRLAYGPVDSIATHCLLLQQNPDWFYLSGTIKRVCVCAITICVKWLTGTVFTSDLQNCVSILHSF